VLLAERYHLSIREASAVLGVDEPAASRALVRLCRMGCAMFDVEARRYRHRELFETPADEARYFPPDLKRELAQRLLENRSVEITGLEAEETVRQSRLKINDGDKTRVEVRNIVYRDWRVRGRAGDASPVEIVVNDTGRIIFGRCSCAFFADNLMNLGPCEHMLALFKASEDQRREEPVSTLVPDQPPPTRGGD
jgi:hypothetical protein